jgi:hypothetical protein
VPKVWLFHQVNIRCRNFIVGNLLTIAYEFGR